MSLHRPSSRSRQARRLVGAPPRGFTLIELLVVIAVIMLLAALALPVLQRATRFARRAKCVSNQGQIGKAFHMYATNNDGCLPTTPGGSTFTMGGKETPYKPQGERPLNKYLGAENYELFLCPADGGRQSPVWGETPNTYLKTGSSYYYLTWDNMLNDPTNARAGKKFDDYVATVSASFLMGDWSAHAFGFEMAATGQDPYHVYRRWHDPRIRCNILFMDLHADYIQMQWGESWPGFTWR